MAGGLTEADATGGRRGVAVEVRDVFHIYREADVETVALRGVNLAVEPGAYVAVMGRSGSGKSTLLNLLAGAERPSAGVIRVDGVDLAQAPEAHRARLRGRTIGYVAQSGNLVEFLTVRENLELAVALSEDRADPAAIEAALEVVNLASAGGRRPRQLSGGEQQRAALALMLMTRPGLVLCDELTGELDRASAALALDALDTLQASVGSTVIAATHDADVASRARHVVTIVDGRLEGRASTADPPWP